MKLEFDPNDTRQVKAAHAAIVSLMNGGGTAAPAASPTPAASTTTATAPAAAAASSPAPATAPAAAPSVPATSAGGGVPTDMAAATAAFQAFVKSNGPGKAKAIIEEFGVKSVKDIPAERLGEFVGKLQA